MHENIGNKAQRLLDLKSAGFNVPSLEIYKGQSFEDVELNFPIAVRSSATCEDSGAYSFAGLFESVLNIKNKSEYDRAVRLVERSKNSTRVQEYIQKNNLEKKFVLNIFLQEMVDADYAGVAFSVHPVTGRDDEILVNICKGLGDKLVSGQIQPEEIVLKHRGFILRSSKTAGYSFLEDLRQQTIRIQGHFGKPQDMEFAVKDGQIYILQSRDITVFQYAKDFGEWTTADLRDGGVSARSPSVFMANLYHSSVDRSFKEYFSEIKLISRQKAEKISWAKIAFGKLYWNLGEVKQLMRRVPGFNERNFDKDLSVPINYEGDGVTTSNSLLNIIKILPTAFALERKFKTQLAFDHKFIREYAHKTQKFKNKIERFDKLNLVGVLASFKDLIDNFYCVTELNYFKTLYNASNAKLEFQAELDKLEEKKNIKLSYLNLLSGLKHLKVLAPNKELYKIAEAIGKEAELKDVCANLSPNQVEIFRDKIESDYEFIFGLISKFLKTFYHHSEIELDLRVPRWGEDDLFIYKMLFEQVRNFSLLKSPRKIEIAQRKIYKAELAKNTGPSRAFLKKLRQIRDYTWMREEMRDCSTKTYYLIRQYLLEIGSRVFRNNPEQIFNFSYEQILKQDFAAEDRIYFEGFRDFDNPNEIGSKFELIDPKTKSRNNSVELINLTGIGSSTGVVRGKARVLRDIDESACLQANEILVTKFTDPGWTPLFGIASGVVTETGGMLSHAAVISREYGMPAVLNVDDATSKIKTGQEIIVDGSSGTVEILL